MIVGIVGDTEGVDILVDQMILDILVDQMVLDILVDQMVLDILGDTVPDNKLVDPEIAETVSSTLIRKGFCRTIFSTNKFQPIVHFSLLDQQFTPL